MKMIGAEAAAESFAVFASGFPAAETAPAGAASVRESNVVKGSRRVLESGFPRRSLGRFGSSIGASAADAFAVSDAAGAFAVSGGLGALAGGAAVGGGAGGAGFGWSLSLSLLSESAFSLRR